MGLMDFEARGSQGPQAVLDVRRGLLTTKLATRDALWSHSKMVRRRGYPAKTVGRLLPRVQTLVLAAPTKNDMKQEKVDNT